MEPDVALELQRLQIAYATALDRRDADLLRDVFQHDAELALFRPGDHEAYAVIAGHEHLAGMVDAMAARYAATMHALSNHTCDVRGDDAEGSAYCVAHHLIEEDSERRQFVVHLRYDDAFRRAPDGTWRIARRAIRFQWSHEHPALDWDVGAARGRLT